MQPLPACQHDAGCAATCWAAYLATGYAFWIPAAVRAVAVPGRSGCRSDSVQTGLETRLAAQHPARYAWQAATRSHQPA